MFNGCIAKNEFETNSSSRAMLASKPLETKESLKTKKLWKKTLSLKSKKDCVDCYATPIKPSKTLKKPLSNNKNKHYGSYGYREKASDTTVKTNNSYVAPVVSYVNSSYGSYSSVVGTAVQVGAFRKYDGAQVYMKRYKALSSRYNVAIKMGIKMSKPIYRVRIEGFKSKIEAKKFMNTYGLTEAFVVIK